MGRLISPPLPGTQKSSDQSYVFVELFRAEDDISSVNDQKSQTKGSYLKTGQSIKSGYRSSKACNLQQRVSRPTTQDVGP